MLERYADVSVEDDMVIICVVGDLKWYNVGFEHQIVEALKDIPVRMISYGDNCDVSFVMRRDDKKRALEALSQRVFINSKITLLKRVIKSDKKGHSENE